MNEEPLMSPQAILIPVFLQVGLTLFLCFWLGVERARQLKRGKVEIGAIALEASNWPAKIRQIGNCFANQFELPVLFYLVVVLALETQRANLLFVFLESLFVATRFWHATIQTTSNDVRKRGRAFGFGVIILVALWFDFALRLFAHSAAT
jgi:hypothetical protein